jgi:single-strand DNA-binding protein
MGADPKFTTFQNGGRSSVMNVATDHSYTDSQGQRVNRTGWHRVVVFGNHHLLIKRLYYWYKYN